MIAALNEMGVCEMVPQKRKRKPDDNQAAAERTEEVMPATMMVKRSRILEWARRNKVDLIGPVKEEGFLGEWALSDPGEGDFTDSSSAKDSVES